MHAKRVRHDGRGISPDQNLRSTDTVHVRGSPGTPVTTPSWPVDTSLFDVAMHNLNYPATWYLNAGTVQGREARSAHPSLTPSQLYRTADGWIMIMCNKERFWGVLAAELGHPEWIDDARFASFPARLENRAEVTRML